MYVAIFCLVSSLAISLVKTAPARSTNKRSDGSKDVKSTAEEREKSFEKFFMKVSEEMMEDSEKEIQKIIEAENALYKEFAEILGGDKNGDVKAGESRKDDSTKDI